MSLSLSKAVDIIQNDTSKAGETVYDNLQDGEIEAQSIRSLSTEPQLVRMALRSWVDGSANQLPTMPAWGHEFHPRIQEKTVRVVLYSEIPP